MTASQLSLFAEPHPKPARKRVGHLDVPERVRRGDLWRLGRHRLLCGDATNVEDVARLFDGVKPEACITDPPYGIAWDTDYTRFSKGMAVRRTAHGGIAGDKRPFDPTPLLTFRQVVLWGANCYPSRLPVGSALVWDKRHKNGMAFLADGEVAWMNRGHGVYIYSLTSQGFIRPEPVMHPTQKPVALMEWCMSKAKAGTTVYDPYCGSGPVLLACERTDRTCYGCEIEPHYCDVILARWEQATGQHATRLQRWEVSA